jgi:hypothetical protein
VFIGAHEPRRRVLPRYYQNGGKSQQSGHARAAKSLQLNRQQGGVMTTRRPKWQLITLFTGTLVLAAATSGLSQFTSFNDRTRSMLEGNWQSCRESDGTYTERVYDGKLPGVGPFEFHMGPYHEFALFRSVQDDHRDHNSAENLLKPYTVDVVANVGRQKWDAVGLHIEVALAGGSREECESWWVQLRRADTTSSH